MAGPRSAEHAAGGSEGGITIVRAIRLLWRSIRSRIIKARGVDGTVILRQKMEFILIDTIADQGIDLSQTSRCDMRRSARENAHLLL